MEVRACRRLVGLVAVTVALVAAGCGEAAPAPEAEDPIDGSFLTAGKDDSVRITEGSPEARRPGRGQPGQPARARSQAL